MSSAKVTTVRGMIKYIACAISASLVADIQQTRLQGFRILGCRYSANKIVDFPQSHYITSFTYITNYINNNIIKKPVPVFGAVLVGGKFVGNYFCD